MPAPAINDCLLCRTAGTPTVQPALQRHSDGSYHEDPRMVQVICECGAASPRCRTAEIAINFWNAMNPPQKG